MWVQPIACRGAAPGCTHPAAIAAPNSRRRRGSGRGPACSASASTSQRSEQLVEWLGSEGVDVSKVAVGTGGHLECSRAVPKGEALLSIPDSAWITKDTAVQSELGPHVAGLEPWVAVALLLLHERRKPLSRWRPYLDSLPKESASPLAWPSADLELLRGTQLLAAVDSYRAYFRQRHQQLSETLFAAHPGLFDPQVYGYEAFLWAACTVRARAHAPLDGDDVALVPLADLTLHRRVGGATWQLKGAGLFGRGRALAVEAERALWEGDPVAMDYGPERTEGQVLLDHGAIDPASARGTFALTITLPPEDRFYDDKLDILEGAGLAASNEFVLRAGVPPPVELLACLRLLNLQGPDSFLLESIFRADVWETLQLPVAEDNERAVYQSMVDGCTAALGGYHTTLDEDFEAQRRAVPGSRAAAAAQVRLGEKEALDGAMRFFEDRVTALPSLEYYAERRLKRLGLLDKEGKPPAWDDFFNDGIA